MGASEVVSSIRSENGHPVAAAVEPSAGSAPDPAPTPMDVLRRLAVQGSIWTIIGHGASEAIRLGGHLIVAALVVPDVFGIMAMVTVFMAGLKMFSDIGIGPSIVQDARGDERSFLNTAWTIQVGRGFALAAATVALAWPFAHFYYAQLVWLLPVAAIGPVINGFNSTSLASLHRRLSIGRLTMFELAIAFVRAVASVGLVVLLPKIPVYALIFANLLAEFVRMVASHTILPSDHNRLHWDADSARRLFRFGRWIFISTALTFFIGHGDKLIMGKLLTEAQLGVYVIAFFLSQAVPAALRRLSQMVLFPLYARLSEHGGASLRREMFRVRAALMALTLPVFWVLAIFGTHIVDLLYDDEYLFAGWMLQILAMGTVVSSITQSVSPVVLAVGDSFRSMILLITRSVFLFTAMVVGYHFGDELGLVIGVASASALNYPVLAWSVRRSGAWMPKLDLGAIVISAIVITVGLLIVGLPETWGQMP